MESTHERIVSASRRLFAENGYKGTTTAEIARTAGVAEGTIYRYFRDKKELFIACVEPALREVIRRETAVVDGSNPRDVLRKRIIERVRVIREQMDVFNILLTEGKSHPEIAALLIQQLMTSVTERELGMMRQAIASGAYRRPPNPLIMNVGLTAAIWAMLSVGPAADQLFADWPAPARFEHLEEDLADLVCNAFMGLEGSH